MKEINDPVFGRLEFDGEWIGRVDIPFLKQSFELHINNAATFPPDEEQRDFWSQFMDRQEIFAASVERALFYYYCSHLMEHKVRYEFEPAQEKACLPTLEHSHEIWALLKPTRWQQVWMDAGSNDTPDISISFVAAWDDEHGLNITFYKDQIGIAEGGAHWSDQDHFDLNGQRIVDSNT
jgi:hypothetical protein